MKKVIALALTLAVVLAMGVTAFASGISVNLTTINVGDAQFTINVKEALVIENGVADMKIKDVNGFMTFGAIMELSGNNGSYVVEATGTKLGVTEIEVTDKDGNTLVKSGAVTIAKAPEATPTTKTGKVYGINEDGTADEAALDAITTQTFSSEIVINLGVDDKGVSAAVYNAATKLHPEKIVIVGEDFTLTLNRGDYKTITLDKNLYIDVEVSDRYVVKSGDKEKDMNNEVLAALGNNKADPFYVVVDSSNIDQVADKPEFVVNLDTNFFDFYQWTRTNDCKVMTMYNYNSSDASVSVVANKINVNNLFDNEVTMPTVAKGVYVFVDATNAAGSTANVKDNVSTGANDMMAVMVVFATIALAGAVSKKVR